MMNSSLEAHSPNPPLKQHLTPTKTPHFHPVEYDLNEDRKVRVKREIKLRESENFGLVHMIPEFKLCFPRVGLN